MSFNKLRKKKTNNFSVEHNFEDDSQVKLALRIFIWLFKVDKKVGLAFQNGGSVYTQSSQNAPLASHMFRVHDCHKTNTQAQNRFHGVAARDTNTADHSRPTDANNTLSTPGVGTQ